MGTGMTDIVCRKWYLKDLGTGKDELASVIRIAALTLEELGVPEYSSSKSKRMFSDRFKIGLLVLKAWLDVSYRMLCRLLNSMPGVLAAGGAEKVPEWSTLRKFASRLDPNVLRMVIAETAGMICGPGVILAVDGTGFSESNASRHYVRRMKQMGAVPSAVKDYAKATFAGDVTSKAVAGCVVSNSLVSDKKLFVPVLEEARTAGLDVNDVLGDMGYDWEFLHEEGRRIFGPDVGVWIPPRRIEPKSERSSSRWRPGGRYRKSVYETIGESSYNLRSQIETINSMIKRTSGDMVYGKNMAIMEKEILCKVIVHNLKLLIDSGWIR